MNFEKTIRDIISIALLAPSVHNTQPWNVSYDKDSLYISRSEKRQLTHGDSTGRETYISLGIFAEACIISARAKGINASETVYESDKDRIKLTFNFKKLIKPDIEPIEALSSRYTDRSIYEPVALPNETLTSIESVQHPNGIIIKIATDEKIKKIASDLIRKGLLMAFSSPDFRHELAEYLVPNKKTPFGISIPSLQVGIIKRKVSKTLVASGLNKRQEAELEYKRWMSASGIVFIFGDGDNPDYWIKAGRAYLRTSLQIEKVGLNQATSAAIVEASDFHEDIENIMGTHMRLLAMLRIGKGKGKSNRYKSGRLTVEDIIT